MMPMMGAIYPEQERAIRDLSRTEYMRIVALNYLIFNHNRAGCAASSNRIRIGISTLIYIRVLVYIRIRVRPSR